MMIPKLLSLITSVAILLPAGRTAMASENLLTLNPNFEEQAEGWSPVDGTYWSISKNSLDRAGEEDCALLRVIFKGTAKDRTFTVWNTQEIPVEPGERYTLSAAFQVLAPGSHRYSQVVVLKVYDGRNEIAVLEGEKIENSRRYSIFPSSFTMPKDAAYVKVGLRVIVNETADDLGYLFFDKVSLTKE
jgi:hypothetical protein